MEEIISKEEIDELMKIKGEGRGVIFKTAEQFIIKKEGKEGFKKVEEILNNIGYPIKYRDITPMNFYSTGLEAVFCLLIKRLFNYGDEEFQEIGRHIAKANSFTRFFVMYFVSLDKVVKEAPEIWKKYFTTGNLKVVKRDDEKRYIVLRIENWHSHPYRCSILRGFFPIVAQVIIKKKVSCEEAKCIYKRDEYHEFLLKW